MVKNHEGQWAQSNYYNTENVLTQPSTEMMFFIWIISKIIFLFFSIDSLLLDSSCEDSDDEWKFVPASAESERKNTNNVGVFHL